MSILNTKPKRSVMPAAIFHSPVPTPALHAAFEAEGYRRVGSDGHGTTLWELGGSVREFILGGNVLHELFPRLRRYGTHAFVVSIEHPDRTVLSLVKGFVDGSRDSLWAVARDVAMRCGDPESEWFASHDMPADSPAHPRNFARVRAAIR